MNDDELMQKLRSSRPALSFPDEFQREIWGRIESAERPGFFARAAGRWQSLLDWIARPVPAVALTLATGVLGCLIATTSNRSPSPPAETVYIKSVSPFAAAKIGAQ